MTVFYTKSPYVLTRIQAFLHLTLCFLQLTGYTVDTEIINW